MTGLPSDAALRNFADGQFKQYDEGSCLGEIKRVELKRGAGKNILVVELKWLSKQIGGAWTPQTTLTIEFPLHIYQLDSELPHCIYLWQPGTRKTATLMASSWVDEGRPCN